jgi:hypothetical protein
LEKGIRGFILKIFITALACYVLAYFVASFLIKWASFLEVYWLIPYLLTVTVGFHVLVVKATKGNNSLFMNKYIAFSGLKLMLYVFSILIYLLFIKFEVIIFLLSFITIYFIFTIVEVSSLMQIFKKS